MTGDFNEITGHHEKIDGRIWRKSSFLDFWLMRQSCGMMDFPYIGNCLSWVGRRGRNVIRCHLDRSMGNEEWHEMFTHTFAEYMRFMGLDHRPVLTHIMTKKIFGTKKICFDKRWLSKPNFEPIVREGWFKENTNIELAIGGWIKMCHTHISRWRKRDQQYSSEVIDNLKILT